MAIYEFSLEFLMLLLIAGSLALVFHRLKLPPVLAYLFSGALIGPYGFQLTKDLERINTMAELGIFFLMLTIGLEFSLDRLRGIRRVALFGGSLQILFSIGISMLFAHIMGWTPFRGFFLGSIIALSSTAIVLKFLSDEGQLDSQYGRVAVGILLFQDFAVVPLTLIMSSFGGAPERLWHDLAFACLKVLLFIGVTVGFSRYLLPIWIRRVTATQNREIFFLCLIVLCLAMACLSFKLGLSFAIGAFFAGLMLANTDVAQQFTSDLAPLRHIFVSLFFVSVGLLFDVRFLLDNAPLILAIVSLVLLINFVLMTGIIMICGFAPRIALAVGLILSQIGEFSFLLLQTAKQSGIIQPFFYSLLLSTTFVTMLLTPFLFRLIPWITKVSGKIPLLGLYPFQEKETEASIIQHRKSHVLICGFGPNGRELAFTFHHFKIPFTVMDFNREHIRAAKQRGYDAIYGDASNQGVLEYAGIREALAVIISFPDPIGMRAIVQLVERLNPKILLAVRTRYQKEMPVLYEDGADIVVMDEWEAGIEMQRLVLPKFGISTEAIESVIQHIRQRKELSIEEAILLRPRERGANA